MKTLPAWKLERIYSSFTGKKLQNHLRLLGKHIKRLAKLIESPPKTQDKRAYWIKEFIDCYNMCSDLFVTLYAFAYMHYTINTANYEAIKCMNDLDKTKISLISSIVTFRNTLAGEKQLLKTSLRLLPELKNYVFFLNEQLILQKHQMTKEQEELAADLSRSGADLWSRLQEAVSSQTSVVWDEEHGKKKTIIELRALAHEPDRQVRHKAYSLELSAWETVKTPLAYALNGVKGVSVSLNKRREYKNTLECSLLQARISRNVLNSLITVMEKALPDFRRYLKAKAKILGLKKLAFFDLFAPLSPSAEKWSFSRARDFIIQGFARFSQELKNFALKAFNENWIDAQPKTGKIGGAYCISLPLPQESRILCNFDGSFSAVTTIAHELGHAYHHHLLRKHSAIHRDYPMTLAETASIFCENIIINNALLSFPAAEKINLLEIFLADSTQVIVDILSRFYFESELIDLRAEKELSADELNNLMLKAQQKTYGQALDPAHLHAFMWAVKSHYYRSELAFYNYPYAFGLLFGLGLHALYTEQGASFTTVYDKLLKDTGRMNCMELTRQVGFNIESTVFWQKGMDIIKKRIDEFVSLA
ncbi:MAG: M3 family oligoendopeptidase [Spirochaetales bacterium]|nr:M3 family oligoendopeptidase [Spirochaetales bacterium]